MRTKGCYKNCFLALIGKNTSLSLIPVFAGVDGDGNSDKEPIDGDNNDDIQVNIDFNHSVDYSRINFEFQPPPTPLTLHAGFSSVAPPALMKLHTELQFHLEIIKGISYILRHTLTGNKTKILTGMTSFLFSIKILSAAGVVGPLAPSAIT